MAGLKQFANASILKKEPNGLDELTMSDPDNSFQPVPVSGCVSSLQQSDYPYNENVPNIKIPMDIMEKEPFLGDKACDSE